MRKQNAIVVFMLTSASIASAQSSVTLFGVVDLSFQNIKAGDNIGPGVSGNHINRLEGGQYTFIGNRLGFRFVEDLGGGLSAGGILEAGFLPDTGTSAAPTVFFNRQSYIYLNSKDLGELRLGRQYRFQDEVISINSPFNNGLILGPNFGYRTSGTLAAPAGFLPMFIDNARVDNAIHYTTPTVSGFKFQTMIAAGEDIVPRYEAIKGSYVDGPLATSIAYEQDNNPLGPKAKIFTAGLAYEFSFAKLMGGYQRGRDLNAAFVGAALNPAAFAGTIGSYSDTNSYTLGIRKDFGPLTLGTNYSNTKFTNASGSSQSLGRFGVGASYAFSKQTRLFAAYGQAMGDLKDRIVEKRLIQFGINKAF